MKNFFKRCIQIMPESGNNRTGNERKIKTAVCALLLEIANSDDEISGEERTIITDAVKNKFGLSEAETAELIEAAEVERGKSVDLWHFTNLINEHYSLQNKISLIEALWEIIYADKVLDQYEDQLIHKLANLLSIDHKYLIAAKLKAKAVSR